jgi:hypothetical protein
MRLVLFDKSEMIISKEQADKIKQLIENGCQWIDINGELLRPNAIIAIRQGGRVETPYKQISPPDYRGVYSPAKEKLRQKFNKA